MLPIYVFLTDRYSDWEIAPMCGLGRAFYGADIRFVTERGGNIQSVSGQSVTDTLPFAVPDAGVVVVCGGPAFEGRYVPDLSDQLQHAYANGCTICGICSGTLALARAGLLDGIRHTSNAPDYIKGFVPSYSGEEDYIDHPGAVSDCHVITAPAHSPVSFAVETLVASGLERSEAAQISDLLAQEHRRLNMGCAVILPDQPIFGSARFLT